MNSDKAFTLIELAFVMAILGILYSVAMPVGGRLIQKSRESTLKQNLSVMRQAIDGFYADRNRYPYSLNELVETGYLREIPIDPFTDSNTSWVFYYRPLPDSNIEDGLWDVKSSVSNYREF